MTATDKYFQFPILVAREVWTDSKSLCSAIIDIALCDMAVNAEERIDEQPLQYMAERYSDRHDAFGNEQMMAAAEYLGVNLGMNEVDEAFDRMKRVADRFPISGMLCRLRTDILWSMTEWPLSKTRILIGVYAGVGARPSQWLSYSRIQTLAAGYSSVSEMPPGTPQPSMKQTRYWVDLLWRRNLFQTVTEGMNKRHYSIRHKNDAELRSYIQSRNRVRKSKQRTDV